MLRLFGAACLAALSTLAVGHAAAQPLLPTQLVEDDSLKSPRLSPNGQLVASYLHEEDGDTIVLMDASDSERASPIDMGGIHLRDLQWADDHRLLLSVLRPERVRGFDFHSQRLVVLDIRNGDMVVADPKSRGLVTGRVLHIDEEGDFAIVASEDRVGETPTVKRIDLATGDAEILERDRHDVWRWAVDSEGVVRAGIAVEDGKYRIYYRQREGEDLRKIKGRIDERTNVTLDSMHFGLPGADAVVVTNADSDRFAAYRFDFETGEVGDKIFEHETADLDDVIFDGDYRITGFTYQDDRPRTHWIDEDYAALQAKLDRALPDRNNVILDFSRDNGRVLLFSSGPTAPGTYFVLDEAERTMAPIISRFPDVDAERLSPTRSVTYAARDGLDIPAYLTLPKGGAQEGLPLILMPHGGPYARDDWGYDPLVQLFASRGYAVFQPQFRGSTGRGRAFVEAGFGEWGRGMQDDLDDGVDWLAAQGLVDPARVCIVGSSFGGYAAMWGAIRNPERYRCAVSHAGVSDLDRAVRHTKRAMSAKRYFRDWRDSIRGMERLDLDQYSPIEQAERLSVPLFLSHGEKDGIVDVDQTTRFARALERAGKPFTLRLYPDGGHSLDQDELIDYMQRISAFVAEHNPS
ncbi:alpha/beta hydrolase family protein [Sphingomicrobium arenosum]|uniref:alpha/beta hydrolase family protein n=1 Tax=Sphingomicrobium arenosum TaxID=2233861 RepID=UPI002240F90E|nr:S9 family peptidase [Sphingomicrobium arenosum]